MIGSSDFLSKKTSFNLIEKSEYFSHNCTAFIKVIALQMMIFHHLFWNKEGWGIYIGNYTLSQRLGCYCKICVDLFIILSGIGLTLGIKNTNRNATLKQSVIRCFKLWEKYIFYIIASGIIGTFLFRFIYSNLIATFDGRIKFVLTLTGWQYLFGYQGYNDSWWYITLSFCLYLLFPLLYKKIFLDSNGNIYGIITCIVSYICMFSTNYIESFVWHNFCNIVMWLPPFILSLLYIKNDIYICIYKLLNIKKIFIIFLLIFITFLFLRMYFPFISGITFIIDLFNSFLILILMNYIYLKYLKNNKKINSFISFMNYFTTGGYLIHKFITDLGSGLFLLKNPFIIFLAAYFLTILVAAILKPLENRFINLIDKVLDLFFKRIILKGVSRK